MARIPASKTDRNLASIERNKPAEGNRSQNFDAHKHVMKSNEAAAQSRSYDPDDMTRIYQEATDGDGEEAQALAQNGKLTHRRTSRDDNLEPQNVEQSRSTRAQDADKPRDEDPTANGAHQIGETSNKGLQSGDKISAANRTGEVETASLSQRQESLVARLVTLPDDYRGLSAANTETTFDTANWLEKKFGSSELWTRAPDTERSAMTDQIANTMKKENEHV